MTSFNQSTNKLIAILLLAFGGPSSLDEIESFLTSVMAGREPSPEQLAKVTEKYGFIGGCSPVTKITFEQAKLLEEKLNFSEKKYRGMNRSGSYRVYVGFAHSRPTIKETVKKIVSDKIEKVVVLSLAPYYSKVTTAAYIEKLRQAIKEIQIERGCSPQGYSPPDFEISIAGHLGNYPLCLIALVEKIEEGLKKFSSQEQKNLYIIFSVHSIPQRFIDHGDPYLEQVKTSINSILKISSYPRWNLAFQSRGSSASSGKEKWLEPEVKEKIDELAKNGVKNILLVPLSFISENIETLYDIDIIYKKYAEEKGLKFIRTSCLNTSPKFIEVLSNIVNELNK